MKVDLTKEILDYEGNAVKLNEKENHSVGSVLKISINTVLKGDEEDSGEDRMRKHNLAIVLVKNSKGDIEVDSEDITMLKERVRKTFPGPLVYGRIVELFGDKK